MTQHVYKPVVFTAGGEDGVCGSRHFVVRPGHGVGFYIYEDVKGADRVSHGTAPNLGEVKKKIEVIVNGVEATITKHFHRDEGVMRKGDVVREKMRFVSVDEMDRHGAAVNLNHESVPYSINSAVVDERNFVFYDMSVIENIYGELPWNELNA